MQSAYIHFLIVAGSMQLVGRKQGSEINEESRCAADQARPVPLMLERYLSSM